MSRSIRSMYQGRYIGLPVALQWWIQGPQHLYQGLVKSSDLAITHRVVWHSPRFLDSSHLAQMLNNLGLKILSLVAMQPGREAIMHEEMLKQSSSSGAGCLVSGWNDLCKVGEVVNDDKYILVHTLGCRDFR